MSNSVKSSGSYRLILACAFAVFLIFVIATFVFLRNRAVSAHLRRIDLSNNFIHLQAGSNINNEGLYFYVGKNGVDVDGFRNYCREFKFQNPDLVLYRVLLDTNFRMNFPEQLFFAQFDGENELKRHIIAIHKHNRVSGFSEFTVYETNMAEGKASREIL